MKFVSLSSAIPDMVSNAALRNLRLTKKDVLLDIGTGSGEKAIICAKRCELVIGVDIDLKRLRLAKENAKKKGMKNIIFAYGSFEKPCAELDLSNYDITRILALYSLHHLPDGLKKRSLRKMSSLMHRPARIVIGDIIFFDEPEKYQKEYERVHFDGGITDFPSSAEFLIQCLKDLNAKVEVVQVHPLAGVITADFL